LRLVRWREEDGGIEHHEERSRDTKKSHKMRMDARVAGDRA
jgi:hypothetical protein